MHPGGLHTHRFTCTSTDANTTHPKGMHSGPPKVLYMLSLPRLHAADGVVPQAGLHSLPKHVGKPEFPNTGWDRIKDLFDGGDGEMYSEEVKNVGKGAFTAALVGLLYGGLPGARHARERFIQLSHAEIYRSRVEAVRSAHNAAIRGFVRYGWRWSWRVAAFVTLFNTVSTGISVYRDSNSLSHFAVAGAVTGGVFRMNLGLRGMVAGSIIGAALGVPAGAVIVGLQKLGGETLREKRQRERRELYELRVAEWNARLQFTNNIMGTFSGQDPEGDLQRITEILCRPPNQESTKES